MVSDLRQILLGSLLSDTSRDHLLEWLQASTTGTHELHAGLPPDWRMGDKTGSGRRGTTNDVAIIWPTGRSPILVAAFLTDTAAEGPARNVTLAMVGRAIADWVAAGAPR